jgi:hypothetical protein
MIAIAVLLLGAAIGFVVGYEVRTHRTTTKTVASSTTAQTPAKSAPAKGGESSAQTAQFRYCLASHGVQYPVIAGGSAAFATQLDKPPVGVAQSTYTSAIRACYAAALRSRK